MRQLEKFVLLQTIDQLWKEHLLNMDHLKEGIGLRGYGQRNPLQEYQKEGFEMFEEMIGTHARGRGAEGLHRAGGARRRSAAPRAAPPAAAGPDDHERRRRGGAPGAGQEAAAAQRDAPKVGRNDPCPCGSGKKYKKCHGA